MNSPCADRGCTTLVGEFCEYHQVVRWDCICLDDDLDPRCPVHAQEWADGYEGDLPASDDEERDAVVAVDGTVIIPNADSYVAWLPAVDGLLKGSYVIVDGQNVFEWKTPADGPPHGLAMHDCPVGDVVQVLVWSAVPSDHEV